MRIKNIVSTASLLATMTFVAACSSQPQKSIESTNLGFLNNYDKMSLVRQDEHSQVVRWVSDRLTISDDPYQIKAIQLKTVRFYPSLPDNAQIDQSKADEILNYFNQSMVKVSGKYFPLVERSGPGVLSVQPVISSIDIRNEALSPLELIPFKAVIASINYAAGGRDRDVTVQLEILSTESTTQSPLVTSVYQGMGQQLENDSELLSLDHVKQLIDHWAMQWDKDLAQYKTKQ